MNEKDSIEGTRKSKVTSFFLAILVGIAISASMEPSQKLLGNEFEFSLKYFILTWSIPLVFLITIIRFFIGNILHMINLEVAVTKPNGISPMMWLWDFSALILEAIIFIFMGLSIPLVSIPIESGTGRFLVLIIILFSFDFVWILSTYIFGCLPKYIKLFKNCKRDSIPTGWAILNTISALMIYGILNAYNNFKFFVYLLVIFVYTGLFVWLFLTIIDKNERVREVIFGWRNSMLKRVIEQIINNLNDKEENSVKRLKKIMPWIVGINTLFYFIILLAIFRYNFDIAYLMFITYGLTVAAFIDIYCLDIYKILTNG